MRRKLFLHMGVHRTGTSSIQHFLKANFGTLLGKGVFHAYAVARHDRIFADLFAGRLTALDLAQDIAARADAKPVAVHTVTLSDEDISCQRDLSPLAPLAEVFDLRPVIFLRRQDLWLESWYRQNIKWQWDKGLAHLPFDGFLRQRHKFHWIVYDRLFERAAALAGAENVCVLPMEAAHCPDGAVGAFLDVIGLRNRKGLAPETRQNAALSPLMTEFMRHLPLGGLPASQRHLIEQACAQADQSLASARAAYYLDPDTRAEVLAGYAAGNARLARRVFGRDTLFRDPLPARNAPRAATLLPQDSQEVMRKLVWPVLERMAHLADSQAAPPPFSEGG